MAGKRINAILKRQLNTRARLWPHVKGEELWNLDKDGWAALPRLMPLMMSIMDDLAGKGTPVSRVYLEMWSRLREESFLSLGNAQEMAFHAGFDGQRALRTWRERVATLSKLGFIDLKEGPFGEQSYALFPNPYHVVKRQYLKGRVQERKWQALMVRSEEIKAFDIDEIDDSGNYVTEEE
jgi:hypothetical protein